MNSAARKTRPTNEDRRRDERSARGNDTLGRPSFWGDVPMSDQEWPGASPGDEKTRLERSWATELRERIDAVEAGEMRLLSEEEADAEVEELLR